MEKELEIIYCPRAVAYANTSAANEGGGGNYISVRKAMDLGGTDLQYGEDGYGWATWPNHYWIGLK